VVFWNFMVSSTRSHSNNLLNRMGFHFGTFHQQSSLLTGLLFFTVSYFSSYILIMRARPFRKPSLVCKALNSIVASSMNHISCMLLFQNQIITDVYIMTLFALAEPMVILLSYIGVTYMRFVL
jgi:hypothetical protein